MKLKLFVVVFACALQALFTDPAIRSLKTPITYAFMRRRAPNPRTHLHHQFPRHIDVVSSCSYGNMALRRMCRRSLRVGCTVCMAVLRKPQAPTYTYVSVLSFATLTHMPHHGCTRAILALVNVEQSILTIRTLCASFHMHTKLTRMRLHLLLLS